MRFSPLLVSSLIVKPLRYFFEHHTARQGLVYSDDEKKRTIEIGTINDFHEVKIQGKPRIIVSRGNYSIGKSGLTDNMAQSAGIKANKGVSDRINTIWINGVAQITIESTNEGTCELVADMVSHFIVWGRPLLCDTQGFNEFGLNMSVSECTVDREDKEKFRCVVSFPYSMEEQWNVKWDAVKFKTMYGSITPTDPSIPGPSVPSPIDAPVVDTSDIVGAVQVIINKA